MRLYRKIDIYVRRTDVAPHRYDYLCTTQQARTCEEALLQFCRTYDIPHHMLRASFASPSRRH